MHFSSVIKRTEDQIGMDFWHTDDIDYFLKNILCIAKRFSLLIFNVFIPFIVRPWTLGVM